MDVEIRTTTGTWIAQVDDRELAESAAGAAAAVVRDQIQGGVAIEVRPEGDSAQRLTARPTHLVVFNPGHVVAVLERMRARGASVRRSAGR